MKTVKDKLLELDIWSEESDIDERIGYGFMQVAIPKNLITGIFFTGFMDFIHDEFVNRSDNSEYLISNNIADFEFTDFDFFIADNGDLLIRYNFKFVDVSEGQDYEDYRYEQEFDDAK